MVDKDLIEKVVIDTYGDSSYVRACVNDLILKLDGGTLYCAGRGREHGIGLLLWNWFSGGDTAFSAAKKIEAILYNRAVKNLIQND